MVRISWPLLGREDTQGQIVHKIATQRKPDKVTDIKREAQKIIGLEERRGTE